MSDIDGVTAEFAVVIADPWQGKGIGAALMEHLIAIAQERGIKTLTGLVLRENRTMLALGRKLGFAVKRTEDLSHCELKIDLASIPSTQEAFFREPETRHPNPMNFEPVNGYS